MFLNQRILESLGNRSIYGPTLLDRNLLEKTAGAKIKKLETRLRMVCNTRDPLRFPFKRVL